MMPKAIWRPATEAEATSNMAALIEYTRATSGLSLTPAEILGFQGENPARLRALVADFAGLNPDAPPSAALAPHAARLQNPDGSSASIAAMLKTAGWDGLLDSLAHHLLVAELRPDDRLDWPGAIDDPWPLGALLAGATVRLTAPR